MPQATPASLIPSKGIYGAARSNAFSLILEMPLSSLIPRNCKSIVDIEACLPLGLV